MSNALNWARADLATGLAAASVDEVDVDHSATDLLTASKTKLDTLQTAATNKVAVLQNKVQSSWDMQLEANAAKGSERDLSKMSVSQYGNLEDTVTQMPDGTYESNANKIWNNYSPEQLQMKLGDTIGNYALTEKDGKLYQSVKDGNGNSMLVPYEGNTRRLYAYNTKENGSDVVKFGLSTSQYDTSDARYNPITGWLPGEKGVDVNKKILDVLLPYDKATELEGIIHGNQGALAQRVVKSGDTELRKKYGSGASEYYNSIDSVLGNVSQSDLSNMTVPNTPYVGTKSAGKELATRGITKQAGDFAKAFASSFAKTAVVDVADAVTEFAGAAVGKNWDLGTDDEKSARINKTLNYDNKYANAVGVKLQKLGEQIWNPDVSMADKLAAIGEAAKVAFTSVDTIGTSLGTVAAWVVPGKVLSKLFTAAKEVGVAMQAIDTAVDAGTMSRTTAMVNKAKVLGTADGMLSVGVDQIGHVTAAIGAVNNQYDTFVENNGGKEPEDKAKWFAERFSLQMLNQNLDALTAISVLKSPGLIALGKDLMKHAPEQGAKAVAAKIGVQIADLVAIQAPKEAIQEYTQEMMEMYNERMGASRYKSLDTFTKFVTDEANMVQATAAALGGAGGAGQFKVMGIGQTGIGKAAGKAMETIVAEKTRRADAKVAEEIKPTAEELDFMSDTLAKLDAGTADYSNTEAVLDDLYKAESIFNRQKVGSKSPEVVKEIEELIKSSKARLVSQLDNDSTVPTFGSKEAAEDYIDFVAEHTPDLLLNSKRLNKLEVIAKASGVEEHLVRVKSYFDVEHEAVESPRGYRAYEREIKYAKENSAQMKQAVTKTVKFLDSQERYVEILESALADAEQIAAKHKKQSMLGKPNSIKVEGLTTLTGKPFVIHFNEDGSVNQAGYNVLEVKKRNIEGLNSALGTYAKDIERHGIGGTSADLVVPVASGKEADKLNVLRDIDRAYYKKHGVTKVITDLSGKWAAATSDKKAGAYNLVNKTKIQVKKYTKDDVVLVNIQHLDKKDVPLEMKKKLYAAMEAGATIVFDTDMYSDAKGQKAIAAVVARMIIKRSTAEHKYAAITTKDGGTVGVRVFKPVEVAKKENEESKQRRDKEKEAAAAKQKVFDDELLKFAEPNGSETHTISKEYVAYFKDTVKDGKVVKSASSNAKAYLNRMYDETVAAGVDSLLPTIMGEEAAKNNPEDPLQGMQNILNGKIDSNETIKLTREIPSTKYKSISNAALKNAVYAKVQEIIDNYVENFKTLRDLKVKQEEAKSSTDKQQEFNKQMKSLYTTQFAKSLESSLAENAVSVKDGKEVDTVAVAQTQAQKDAKEPQLRVAVRPLDYTNVKSTLVNSIDAELILLHPVLGPKVKAMVKRLGEVHDATKNEKFVLASAPGAAIVFDKDKEVNVNVALAMVLAMDNFYLANSYMLTGKRKGTADVARMLRIDESEVTQELKAMISDKGMFGKTMVSQISKNIASLLGLSEKTDSDTHMMRYTQAITDLAHYAITTEIAANNLVRDNSLSLSDLIGATDEDGQKKITNEKVIFYKLKNDDSKDELASQYDLDAADLPLDDYYRKEPNKSKPSKEQLEKAVAGIRNDVLGQEIAKEAKDAIQNAMNVEYSVDKKQLEDLLTFKDEIKTFMGYVDESSDAFKKMYFTAQEEQVIKNREVTKEIDELVKLLDGMTAEEQSMWFDFYYSSNGRYFYDSNTINPGTMKQLVRWLVQPKSHRGEIKYKNVKGVYTFTKNGKDVTKQMMFALGQAFGVAVDKQRIDTSVKKVTPILDALMSKDADYDKLFKEALKGSKTKVEVAAGIHVEIEHVAHMRQAMLMLDGLRSTGKAVTSFSAEFDAKTSGFGLKTAQMPIDDGALEMLQQTGMSVGELAPLEEALDNEDKTKNILDAYQSLAKGIKNTIDKFTSVFSKTAPVKPNMALLKLVETADGTITSALRNLFKQPFMEFNYSAGMKSIRQSLARTLAKQVLDEVWATKDNKNGAFEKYDLGTIFSGKVNGKAALIAAMQTTQIENIDGHKKLLEHIDAVIGTQVQNIFEAKFPMAIKAQGVINQAFKAMFGLYAVAYEDKLKKITENGIVTREAYNNMLKELKALFPMIKGPLSADAMVDGIAIYKKATGGVSSDESGGLVSQLSLNTEFTKKHGMVGIDGKGIASSTLQLEMRRIVEAVNAGAVVPIHYIDGAILTKIINIFKDLSIIHDATIPALEDAFDVTKEYNKGIYDTLFGKNRYSLVGEILDSLNRVQQKYKDTWLTSEATTKRRLASMETGSAKDETDITPEAFMKHAIKEVEALATLVDSKIADIQAQIDAKGITIAHMFTGSPGNYTVGKAMAQPNTDIIKDTKEQIFADLVDIVGASKIAKTALTRLENLMKDC